MHVYCSITAGNLEVTLARLGFVWVMDCSCVSIQGRCSVCSLRALIFPPLLSRCEFEVYACGCL